MGCTGVPVPIHKVANRDIPILFLQIRLSNKSTIKPFFCQGVTKVRSVEAGIEKPLQTFQSIRAFSCVIVIRELFQEDYFSSLISKLVNQLTVLFSGLIHCGRIDFSTLTFCNPGYSVVNNFMSSSNLSSITTSNVPVE